MRAQRTTAVVAVVAALALGHAVSSVAQGDSEGFAPFEAHGEVGEPVSLTYADVTVTDVRPAQYVAGLTSGDLASLAGGVWVLVSVEATATREPVRLTTPALRDEEGRLMRASPESGCPPGMSLPTGVPKYALFCFDVPADRLAGLHLQVSRGSLDADLSIRGDHLAVIDLGVTGEDEDAWAQTSDVYGPAQESYEPFELETVELSAAPEGRS